MARVRRICIAAGLAAALLGPTGCGRDNDDRPAAKPPAEPSVAERVRVLNADAYVIDGRHIRLAMAVAPQQAPHALCWAEALAAKQATLAARELMRDARTVRIEPTGKKDEYDREIAHVFLDNLDLAHMLHDAGFVAETSPDRFHWCEPISQGGEGAPDVKTLLDFGRG